MRLPVGCRVFGPQNDARTAGQMNSTPYIHSANLRLPFGNEGPFRPVGREREIRDAYLSDVSEQDPTEFF